jgi:hypothetical protein
MIQHIINRFYKKNNKLDIEQGIIGDDSQKKISIYYSLKEIIIHRLSW